MDDGDDNAHTWRSLAWTAALLVKKLKDHPERTREAEAPRAKLIGGRKSTATEQPPARGMEPREAVKLRTIARPRLISPSNK